MGIAAADGLDQRRDNKRSPRGVREGRTPSGSVYGKSESEKGWNLSHLSGCPGESLCLSQHSFCRCCIFVLRIYLVAHHTAEYLATLKIQTSKRQPKYLQALSLFYAFLKLQTGLPCSCTIHSCLRWFQTCVVCVHSNPSLRVSPRRLLKRLSVHTRTSVYFDFQSVPRSSVLVGLGF